MNWVYSVRGIAMWTRNRLSVLTLTHPYQYSDSTHLILSYSVAKETS